MALKLRVHPLALLGIADHSVRERVQYSRPRAAGAVFGYVDDGEVHAVEVMGVAVKSVAENGALDVDLAPFLDEMGIYSQAYPSLSLLGWYATGSASPLPGDIALHRLFSEHVPSSAPFPAMLFLFDPAAAAAGASASLSGENGLVSASDTIIAASGVAAFSLSASPGGAAFTPVPFTVALDASETIVAASASTAIAEAVSSAAPPGATAAKGAADAARQLAMRLDLIAEFLEEAAAEAEAAEAAVAAAPYPTAKATVMEDTFDSAHESEASADADASAKAALALKALALVDQLASDPLHDAGELIGPGEFIGPGAGLSLVGRGAASEVVSAMVMAVAGMAAATTRTLSTTLGADKQDQSVLSEEEAIMRLDFVSPRAVRATEIGGKACREYEASAAAAAAANAAVAAAAAAANDAENGAADQQSQNGSTTAAAAAAPAAAAGPAAATTNVERTKRSRNMM